MSVTKFNKKEALERLNILEAETKQLRKIIDVPENIMERIKTFEDALEDQGLKYDDIVPYCTLNHNAHTEAVNAYSKLTCIIKSLRQDWAPDLKDSSQPKYYPWFEADKSGVGLSCHGYGRWAAGTHCGVRLCLPTAELTKYAGTQFIDLYNKLNSI